MALNTGEMTPVWTQITKVLECTQDEVLIITAVALPCIKAIHRQCAEKNIFNDDKSQ